MRFIRRSPRAALLAGAVLVASACAKSGGEGAGAGVPPGGADAGAPPGGDADAEAPLGPITGCHDAPVSGAPVPAAPSAYEGTCPTIGTTPGYVTFTGSSKDRRFFVVRPSDEKPGEILPVLFIWPWLRGTVDTAVRQSFQLDDATTQFRFIGVIPAPKGDLAEDWPYTIADSEERVDEDVRFFDDMLACIAQQIPSVALQCTSAIGMSAGALFAAQLVARRSDQLASFVSLSGGVGGAVRELTPAPTHKLPSMVLWGGPTDQLVLSFQQESTELLKELPGHAVVECIHDCGHSIPPFETPIRAEAVYRFALDHPYGLPAGRSPYEAKLPPDFPNWCAFGAGKAVPRQTGGAGCPGLP